MKNKDLLHTKEYYNKNGELVSFHIWCSYKDPLSKKYKQNVKSYKIPNNLKGKKELDAFRLQCQLDLKEQTERLANGILNKPAEDMGFYEFAEKWVENILIRNKQSYSHYNRCKGYLKIFKEKLGKYTLKGLNQLIVQEFCYWLCKRTYKKETIIVKQSIKQLAKEQHLTTRNIAEKCGLAHTTVELLYKVGNRVSRETANKICNGLNIPIEEYFNIKSEQVYYSLSDNRAIKVMLHTILKSAERQGIIDRNCASSDLIEPVTGTKGDKQIFEDLESIKQFIQCINLETDIRKKVAFSLFINLGIRSTELVGLEWKDFDFEKEQVSICRDSIYAPGFGVVTKETKTKKSSRTISIPSNLISLLKQYKDYWEKEKSLHGNLWINTDRLFTTWDGKNMAGSTVAKWLRKFEEDNNLKLVTPHGLRHTNITMQLVNGVDIKTVSARAGHSNISTTLNIYTHYTSEADKKASNLINKLLFT